MSDLVRLRSDLTISRDDLCDEIERLRARISDWEQADSATIQDCLQEIEWLTAERDRYRAALEKYANSSWYWLYHDHGKLAREALRGDDAGQETTAEVEG